MEDPKVVFWLKPAANCPKAEALLDDPANSKWVHQNADKQRFFKVTVGKTSKIEGRFVSFGRPQNRHDIVLPTKGFPSTEHCFFDVNQKSHAIMLHDVSKRHETGLYRHVPVLKDPSMQDGYTLSTDELDNSLSIRTCVILPDQRYTFTIRDMEFLLIPEPSREIELKKFVATVPNEYKSMPATTYLPPEPNKDEEELPNPQSSPRLHSRHATIRHRYNCFLGSGGEAQVYEYLNLQDGNLYACKVISLLKDGHKVSGQGLNSDHGYADTLKKRVADEVRALSGMRHDNIIKYDYTQGWDTNHELRIFMPLYKTTLRNLLPDCHKRVSSDWRLRVGRMIKDVSSALEYINAKQCFHRDIKPDNILASDESFCLTDFGMASFPTRTGPLPVKRGHIWQYAAPEVLRGDDETCAIDIFSFGAMILECLWELPLVTPDPSAANDIAELTLNAHDKYRRRLAEVWPAADLMLSEAPSKRPGANRLYGDLLNSDGVPMPSNARPGDGGMELRSRKRRLDSERGIGTGNQPLRNEGNVACAQLVEPPAPISAGFRTPDAMSWTAEIPERPARLARPAQPPAQQQLPSLRDREARNAKSQKDRQAARRIGHNRGAPRTPDADPEHPAKRTKTANQPKRGKRGR